MIADWDMNTVLISDLLPERHPEIVRLLGSILSEHGITLRTIRGTADIWIRDFAPVQTAPDQFVQFRYEPDYLRDTHRHLITGADIFMRLSFTRRPKQSEINLDGGNLVATAQLAILTSKVFRENPSRTRSGLKEELRRLLRVERLIVIPREPNDLIGHADGMLRFVDGTTVAVNDYSSVAPRFGKRLYSILEKHDLRVELLPYRPEGKRIDGIESAVGNYANYLRVRNLIAVPTYGIPEDDEALRRLEQLCPHAVVVPLACSNLARQGGVLQCATWTVRLDVPERN